MLSICYLLTACGVWDHFDFALVVAEDGKVVKLSLLLVSGSIAPLGTSLSCVFDTYFFLFVIFYIFAPLILLDMVDNALLCWA